MPPLSAKHFAFAVLIGLIGCQAQQSPQSSQKPSAGSPGVTQAVYNDLSLPQDDSPSPHKLFTAAHVYDWQTYYKLGDTLRLANKKEADSLYAEACSLFKRKHTDEAIYLCKEAIQYYPDAKTYMALGQALIRAGNGVEAGSALQIAADMVNDETYGLTSYWQATDPAEPSTGEIYYQSAVAWAMEKDTEQVVSYLHIALASHMKDKDRILHNHLFDIIRGGDEYKKEILAIYFEKTPQHKALFEEYAALFQQAPLPYHFTEFPLFDGVAFISDPFAELVPGLTEGEYSREMSQRYIPLAELKMPGHKSYTLFAYCSVTEILDPEYADYNDSHAYLATYNKNNVLADTLTLGTNTIQACSMGSVSADATIEIKKYKKVWLRDPVQEGLKDNQLLRTEYTGSAYYYIDKQGHFQPAEPGTGQAVHAGKAMQKPGQ